MALSGETLQKFLNLTCDLSPENLTCDGELSQSEVNRRYARLKDEWKQLETQVGHRVTESDVWVALREEQRDAVAP